MIRALLRLAWDWVVFLIQGCQHPKCEPEGSVPVPVDGVIVIFFLETCTVCGITLIHEA